MKVLFAVNNESISESIIKKYQQEYKEIISSKNVYYFDAITRELQKDKSYDRIVISEDVEPFANNNYGVIDKFIFERLDAISDEATTPAGQDIPIILICADRRNKSENILVKLFGIGIYSALLGQDRTISKVCELINKPRNKKEAKVYYKIDADDVDYKAEGEGDVNEVEIQNILNHYKRLGRNEEEYVKSFDNIAEQYTDAQLRVICKFLPLNVKAVLEENSQKYQELITFGTVTPSISQGKAKNSNYVPNKEYQETKKKKKKEDKGSKLDVLEKNIGGPELSKPVIIPGVIGQRNTAQQQAEPANVGQTAQNVQTQAPQMPSPQPTQTVEKDMLQAQQATQADALDTDDIENILQSVETDISATAEPVKKKRGRPKKVQEQPGVPAEEAPKKKRGRPRKVAPEAVAATPSEDEDSVNLFGLGAETDSKDNGEIILPGLDDEPSGATTQSPQATEDVDLFSLGNQQNSPASTNQFASANQFANTNHYAQNDNARELEVQNQFSPSSNDANLKNLISMSNKLVAFVGTSKNGTSFLVNSIAEILSKRGIKTAILDLTQNKNAYYIYTQNDENLRKTAFNCVSNLQSGIAQGIEVNKNLTVYTTLPDRNDEFADYTNILTTLTKNYSLVIMDCDYETNYAYFNFAQEIYLVQSFDILTIQPLTAFLRNLKARNILDASKLRIVLNKVLRVRSITERVIIGGMSSYNDPSMSYMTELFDKDNIQYCSIPFDQEAYSKYLDGLVNCEISTKGYPKNFLASMDKLASMVYPLLANDRPANKFNSYNERTSNFSININETLNKMKNRY